MPQSATLISTSSRVIAWPSASSVASSFGSSLPSRAWSDVSRGYRYGFNGMEKDSKTANDAFPITIGIGARIYDDNLGRWLSLDPLMKKYSEFSPYIISINNPIIFIDIDGRDFIVSNSLFNNSSVYQTCLKVYTNHIILSLIIDIKEDVELTCISPFEDPSNANICEEKINSTYYGVYTISTKILTTETQTLYKKISVSQRQFNFTKKDKKG